MDVALLIAVAAGAWLRFSRLGDYDNQYYTAAVASMLQGPVNFFFGSFDPGGVVTVDKPPLALWVQAIPAALFGVDHWAVSLPQAIAGTLAIPVLYLAVRPAFGRPAALVAALVLAVMPVSVGTDSANEQDSLLSLTLLLAAVCVLRAARTGRRRWLLAFAVLVGVGFNIKMMAALVPLPAFLLYYALAAGLPIRRLALRALGALGVVAAVSFSWVAVVALTPAQSRPYVGSTPDNSIWTLVLQYNGMERFTSLIAPVLRYPWRPMTFGPGDAEPGLPALFANPLAEQLGWLLPLGLFMLALLLASVLRQAVPSSLVIPAKAGIQAGGFNAPRNPCFGNPNPNVTFLDSGARAGMTMKGSASLSGVAFRGTLRGSPSATQALLWAGWLALAAAVFGLARATSTHPYYLANVAVPLAAVAGAGFGVLWQELQRRALVSALLPLGVVGAVSYQAFGARGLMGDGLIAVALAGGIAAGLGMVLALRDRSTGEVWPAACAALAVLALLAMPLASSATAGARLASTGAVGSRQPLGMPSQMEPERAEAIGSFIELQGDGGSEFALATVNAREAAPFIMAGVRALAIGGFSGNDPVFTLDTFRAMVERGEVRYFLMPGLRGMRWPPGPSRQEGIMAEVRRTWQDAYGNDAAYRATGLPPGNLYRYRGAAAGP